MFVRSSSRNVGSRWKPAAIAPRRVAEICAVVPASLIQAWRSALFTSSWRTTVFELLMKFLMIVSWPARIRSTLSVSRRPGCALCSSSEMSCGRPARPVPSSAMISRSLSRYGSRITSPTRSAGIVEVVCFADSVAPLFSRCGVFPGWQST